jgi:catechol 2,3-dioxygenase-like lactoylglutathione lyase family enzyme
MAIFGAHMLLYSSEPEALRAMLRDVFGFPFVDAHGGWLIFALPPAELGVHPGEGPNFESGMRHEISFMCDDIHSTIADLRAKGVQIDPEPQTESYGITARMNLPGGVQMMLYQPLHKMAIKLPQ